MRKSKVLFLTVALTAILAACGSGPVTLAMPDGSERVPINHFSDQSEVVKPAPRLVAQASSAPASAASAAAVVKVATAASAAEKATPASSSASVAAQAGSASGAAAKSPAPAASAPVEVWTVEVSDGSLSRALKRWAQKANVPLIWEAPKDKPAFHAEYTGDFYQAIAKVMHDTKRTDYRVHACQYDNAVRILHESQSCMR